MTEFEKWCHRQMRFLNILFVIWLISFIFLIAAIVNDK